MRLILFLIHLIRDTLETERILAERRGLYVNNEIPKTLGSKIRRFY